MARAQAVDDGPTITEVPYPPHALVDEGVAEEITGLTRLQQKRARHDGLLRFYRSRGRTIRYQVADLLAYRDAMFVPVTPKPKITRKRTPEHNAKIAAAVKAARAKAGAK